MIKLKYNSSFQFLNKIFQALKYLTFAIILRSQLYFVLFFNKCMYRGHLKHIFIIYMISKIIFICILTCTF